MTDRWPTLTRNVGDTLDELEAIWRHALDSGAHVEGDWIQLGLVGNDNHRRAHDQGYERTGNVEDLMNGAGRRLMIRQLQLMIEQARKG